MPPIEAFDVPGEVSPVEIEMRFLQATTPLEAIERALYSLADQVTGTTAVSGLQWLVQLHARSATADREQLAHQLRQSVNDHTLRLRIAERTDPIRNLVFALAFSRSQQPGHVENPAAGASAVDT